MDDNFGIKISLPGINATQTNDPNQLTLNTQYPFHKLDVTNPVSFQNIVLSFENNPPGPDMSGAVFYPYTRVQKTVVYQFPHGYSYIPATWFQNQNNIIVGGSEYGPANGLQYQGRWALIATAATAVYEAEAFLVAEVDSANVYIEVLQSLTLNSAGVATPIDIIGTVFNIRVYCFAEDLTTDIGP